MSSEIVVDLTQGEVSEWGAMLATVMAFPETYPPESLMESCFRSLCAMAIRGRMAHDPAWGFQRQPIKPIFACRDEKLLERDLQHLKKRLRHRMLAGKMCVPFLQVEAGVDPQLPPGVEGLFISQMAAMVLDESGNNEPKNVVARIWHASSRTIHLAVAATIVSSEFERAGQGPLTIAHLVTDPFVIRSVVQRADEYVPLLAKSRRARVDVNSLIRVRLAA